jgi:uncharacterized membrane protein
MPRFDPEQFGRWSEAIARALGTAKFIVYMTVVIGVWLLWNTLAPSGWRFDPYTFTFLTLVLSLQASYAAPLILLAQNRQEARDRVQAEVDRSVADRTQADAEFLAREIAGVRLMLADAVTGDELREQLADLKETLEGLDRRVAEMRRQATTGDDSPTTTSLEAR